MVWLIFSLVYGSICDTYSLCESRFSYDWGDQAILNMGGFCLHHFAFREFLHDFLAGNG